MSVFLDRVDSAPIANSGFSFEFNQWISVLVDTLNEDISDIQNLFNTFVANSYTSAQIASLGLNWADGTIVYDATLNVYVGKQNGVLVQFATSAYP